jgi:NAD(P)H dehydrogenase (quinone)
VKIVPTVAGMTATDSRDTDPGQTDGGTAPARVAVVYHSGFGHTRAQAEAVHRGAAGVPGVRAVLVTVGEHEAHWADLDAADAIVFGTPTYMAGPSADFKAFLDATSERWYEQRWKDKLAAGFTNSAGMSGDKLATLQALALFAMQHGMVWIGLGLMPGNTSSTGSPKDLNRLAAFIGAMAQSHTDMDADVVPPASDRRTAEHLGARVARAALRWRSGTVDPAETVDSVEAVAAAGAVA